MNSLIIYSTTDGQTKKICESIKDNSINKSSYEVVSLNEAFYKEIEKYDQIIIGASIRYGRHSPRVYKFIKENKNILEKKRLHFFQLMLLRASQRKAHQKQTRILESS